MINNFEKSGKQKILLTMKPKLMSSTDSNEKHIMHERDNIENMIGEIQMKSFTNFLIHFCLDIKQVWNNL